MHISKPLDLTSSDMSWYLCGREVAADSTCARRTAKSGSRQDAHAQVSLSPSRYDLALAKTSLYSAIGR